MKSQKKKRKGIICIKLTRNFRLPQPKLLQGILMTKKNREYKLSVFLG